MVDGHHTIGNISVSCTHITQTDGTHTQKLSIKSNKGPIGSQPLMSKFGSEGPDKNNKIWKRNTKPKEDKVTHEQVLNLIPRDIIMEDTSHGDKTDNESVCSNDQEGRDISGESTASGYNENNILCSFLEELCKCSHKDI